MLFYVKILEVISLCPKKSLKNFKNPAESLFILIFTKMIATKLLLIKIGNNTIQYPLEQNGFIFKATVCHEILKTEWGRDVDFLT